MAHADAACLPAALPLGIVEIVRCCMCDDIFASRKNISTSRQQVALATMFMSASSTVLMRRDCRVRTVVHCDDSVTFANAVRGMYSWQHLASNAFSRPGWSPLSQLGGLLTLAVYQLDAPLVRPWHWPTRANTAVRSCSWGCSGLQHVMAAIAANKDAIGVLAAAQVPYQGCASRPFRTTSSSSQCVSARLRAYQICLCCHTEVATRTITSSLHA